MTPRFLAELCESARKLKPKISGRILARLIEAEWQTTDAWVRDDCRIAYLTVLYASRGDRSPHVTGTYKVLGLHPDKIYGAIIERRKAQLGRFYELWNLPPKKPVESYRPAQQEQQRLVVGKESFRPEKPNGAEAEFRATWKPISGKPAKAVPLETMASTQTSYRESGAQTSAKSGDFISRSQIEAMILSADLSVEVPAKIRTKGDRTRPGVRRYRRRHLNSSLIGMWKAGTSPFGKNRIELFASVGNCHEYARVCERQYRYNLRALEKAGVIRLLYQANSTNNAGRFRHTATHELNLDVLRQRCRKLPVPIKQDAVQAEPQQQEPPKPAPVKASSPSDVRTDKKVRQLTPREGHNLVRELTVRMKGTTSYVSRVDKIRIQLHSGDPEYRAPMSQENALVSACMALGIPYDAAVNHLKLCRWEPGDDTA